MEKYTKLSVDELHCEKNMFSGFLTKSDTNPAVQSQKMATGLQFWIKGGEGLYYLCSENKGADQAARLPCS